MNIHAPPDLGQAHHRLDGGVLRQGGQPVVSGLVGFGRPFGQQPALGQGAVGAAGDVPVGGPVGGPVVHDPEHPVRAGIRLSSPSTTSMPPRSPTSWAGWRPAGATAPPPATSGWPRSPRSSGGCSPTNLLGWPPARKSSPYPPRGKVSRTAPPPPSPQTASHSPPP